MNNKSFRFAVPLIVAIVMIVFTLAAYYVFPFGVVAHKLIDIFAGGRSFVKVGLFAAWTVLLCAFAVVAEMPHPRKWKVPVSWLFGAIGVTFLYNLSLLLIYFHKLGFQAKDFVITFHNNEVSSTMLLHNHVMKGVNGLLLNALGSGKQENVDTGLAFVGLLPSIWFVLGGLLVLLCAVLLIIKFVELYNKQNRTHGLFLILYSIMSFSLLKNMLDGGLLNRETPIALAALIFITTINSKRSQWTGGPAVLLPIAVYGVLIILLMQLRLVSSEHFMLYVFPMATFAAVIGTMIYWQYAQPLQKRLAILLTILAAAFVYVPVAQGVSGYLNGQQVIGTDGASVALYGTPEGPSQNFGWRKNEQINRLHIYDLYPTQPVTINQVLADNHLLNNLSPLEAPWVTCLPSSPPQVIHFTLATPREVKDDTTSYNTGYLSKLELINKVGSLYRYRVTAVMRACSPRNLNVIQELMINRGLDTFYILNISDATAGA
jgi:hypothetical protein